MNIVCNHNLKLTLVQCESAIYANKGSCFHVHCVIKFALIEKATSFDTIAA